MDAILARLKMESTNVQLLIRKTANLLTQCVRSSRIHFSKTVQFILMAVIIAVLIIQVNSNGVRKINAQSQEPINV